MAGDDRKGRAPSARVRPSARMEAEAREDPGIAEIVSRYAPEVPALEASERGLRQYQAAETSFLGAILAESDRTAIAAVHEQPEEEIARLRMEIERKVGVAAEVRAALAEARKAASVAREKAGALKRPASAVRARIKRAEAIRAEARKASDEGRYALAYWLVMPGGRLDRAMNAEPAIIEPKVLGDAIESAAAVQKEADERVAALVKMVENVDASLQEDRAELAERQRTLDAAILARLSELNP